MINETISKNLLLEKIEEFELDPNCDFIRITKGKKGLTYSISERKSFRKVKYIKVKKESISTKIDKFEDLQLTDYLFIQKNETYDTYLVALRKRLEVEYVN